MPPQTRKTPDLDALARAVRVSILLIAGALAGCQGSGQIKGEAQAKAARPGARAVDVQFNPSWLHTQPGQNAAYNDIWDRMRDGFQLQDAISTNPRIERQRLWFLSNQSFLEQSSARGSLYMHYVVERLEERNMPLELALLPVIESAYNPFALSRSNAAGLWQFIPATGQHFNLRQTNFYDGRRDITASTNAALTYLERLHEELDIPVLYVSHSPDEVARLADHLVLLENGKVRASGPIGETLARVDLPLALDDDAGVVIEGTVSDHDPAYGLLTLVLPGSALQMRVAHAPLAPGKRLRFKVQARDVSLNLRDDAQSSILNRLPVRVLELVDTDTAAHVLVRLDAGGNPLLARITRYSRDQLQLRPGQLLWAQIKSVAVLA